MRHLRASDYRRSRWKNGKGETLEIAVHPPAATLETFDWRISVALLEADADFSEFPGVDRTLAIIEGEGIELRVSGEAHRLDGRTAPHRFAGDAAASASLISGRSADLNVMTRRGVANHAVARVGAGHTARGSRNLVALFAQSPVELARAGTRHRLGAWDLLHLEPAEAVSIVSGDALEIRVDRNADRRTLSEAPDQGD